MYVVFGATGQVGGATARALLAMGRKVRAVVRDPAKAEALGQQGAELVVADFNDASALEAALRGADGAFIMIPPNFAPGKDFPETRAVVGALRLAAQAAKPARIVCLSSVGAHRDKGLGLITQLRILERELSGLPMPLAFIRAAWFMENIAWDIAPAREAGELASFLSPLERKIPMVATADIGRLAAQTLHEQWTGKRILEIEGPSRYCPLDLARLLGEALGRPVRAKLVARGLWEDLFRSGGAADPSPRMEMLDGINSGWIDFEGAPAEAAKGDTPHETVIARLIASSERG